MRFYVHYKGQDAYVWADDPETARRVAWAKWRGGNWWKRRRTQVEEA